MVTKEREDVRAKPAFYGYTVDRKQRAGGKTRRLNIVETEKNINAQDLTE